MPSFTTLLEKLLPGKFYTPIVAQAPHDRDALRRQFRNIRSLAKDVARLDPEALPSLVKALLRPLQAEQICGVVERDDHRAPSSVDPQGFFGHDLGDPSLSTMVRCRQMEVKAAGHEVDLATDIVLTKPWHRDRLSQAVGRIGTGRKLGPWTPDPRNHSIELWLPWRIAFVQGGNHSIAAGILAGEGTLAPQTVYDATRVLKQVTCDGEFFSGPDGSHCAEVFDARRAGVFMIGRLMAGGTF